MSGTITRRRVIAGAAIATLATPIPSAAFAQADGGAGASGPVRAQVFFPWKSAQLDARARKELRDFVARADIKNPKRLVRIAGHSDLSETQGGYVLSQRRADAAAAFLIGLGLDPASVEVRAVGDLEPLVKTPPGVREPQNRRVEVIALDRAT